MPLLSWFNFRKKIVALVGAEFLVIIALFGYVAAGAVRQNIKRRLEERLETVRIIADRIRGELKGDIRRLEMTASFSEIDLEDGDLEPEKHVLHHAYPKGGEFDSGVALIDREGNILWTEPYLPDVVGSNISKYPHVERALRTGKPTISDVTIGVAGRPIVVLSVPVKSGDGRVTGLLNGALNLSGPSLGGLVSNMRIKEGGHINLLDGKGKVIVSTDPDHISMEEEVYSDVFVSLIEGGQPSVKVFSHRGVRRAVAFAPIPEVSWGVAAVWEEAALIAPVHRSILRMVSSVPPFILAALFLVWLTMRVAVRPVRSLADASRRIASGDLDSPIPPMGDGEIGDLSRGFEAMRLGLRAYRDGLTRRIERRTRELSALRAIASIPSRSLDTGEILRDGLDKILDVVEADAGCMLSMDEAAGELRLAVHKGLSENFVKGVTKLKVGQGLIGLAAQIGEPVVLGDASSDPKLTGSIVREEGLRTLAAIPIKVVDRVLGEIVVARRSSREFTSGDVELLSSIGTQVGVAMEVARLYELTKEQRFEEQAALLRLSNELISTLDPQKIMDCAVEVAASVLKADFAAVFLPEDDGEFLTLRAGVGWEENSIGEVKFKIGEETAAGYAFSRREPVIVPDTAGEERFRVPSAILDRGLKTGLSVPMMVKDRAVGALLINTLGRREFDPGDIHLLSLIANQTAMALENARLFEGASRAKAEWENTFDSVTDLISIHDRDFRLIRVNKALAEKIGVAPEELVGKRCYEIFHRASGPPPNCPHVQTLRTGEVASVEVESPEMGGIYQISTFPLFDDRGEIVGSVHIAKDITEERKLRQQLLHSEKMSAIGQLISGVAHELNNPLTGVIGYAQLLMMNPDVTSEVKEDIERISFEANRARKIIQNLLSFARQHKPERKLVDLNQLVERTLELRQYELRVSNIEVEKDLAGNIPLTLADENQIQQVFLNIIVNAEQAMLEAHGRGKLSVSTRREGDVVKISFSDDGPGIPQENLGRIFDPFFTTKPVGAGTGLGLSVSHGIVEEHGGEIHVSSRVGEGTTFIVELPIVEGGSESAREEKPTDAPKVESKRILVVDDERFIVDVVKGALERHGHRVEVSYGGEEALEKIEGGEFDLIITDVKMPGMDGIDLYNRLRESKPDILNRIAFFTGDTVSKDTRDFLEGVGNPYLAKPFSIEDLLKFVDRAMKGDRNGRRKEGENSNS